MGNGTLDEAYNRVKGFFENEVSQFLVADLERMATIQDHPACTIPESLAVFSFLDLLGFLMRPDFDHELKVDLVNALSLQQDGKDLDTSDKEMIGKLFSEAGRTGKNLEYMSCTWLAQSAEEYKDPLNLALLTTLFRHGGAHQFFPKIGSIGKDCSSKPVIRVRTEIGSYPITHLNQNAFREHFLDSLKLMSNIIIDRQDAKMLEIAGESTEKIVLRMNARLDARLYLDRRQLVEILAELAPRLLPYSSKRHSPCSFQHITYEVDPKLMPGSGYRT